METLKDRIALKALEDAPFDGWTLPTLRNASQTLGRDPQMADALFPAGSIDATRHLADLFDRRLMAKLAKVDTAALRIRDRIALAVMTRIELMTPHKAGLRVALASWANPLQLPRAAKTLWASADHIWAWAGDTATDYNRYTKRALLSGVMASTMLFWLQDYSPKAAATAEFLQRRIETVLNIGRILGKRKAA